MRRELAPSTAEIDSGELPPFLKWAGGKRWLTSGFADIFPVEFERYVEPFLGGGAVFFKLNPRKALLSDANSELINVYQAIQQNHKLVRRYLVAHQRNHSKEYYYKIRSASPNSMYVRAARFIYLNRTCWNGLYRVNRDGQFNVPIGTKSSVILDTDDFNSLSAKLASCRLVARDFRKGIGVARAGDFLFVDPPYTVRHNLNGFVKYNERIFSWDDQIALKKSLVAADRRGVKILMTNADHDSVKKLYRGVFKRKAVGRHSIIAASADKRSTTTELLFYNY